MALVGMGQVEAKLTKEQLFQTSFFASAKISPDGHKLAYIGADKLGIFNAFVKNVSAPLDKTTQISHFATPNIKYFHWSADSKILVLLKDEDGTAQLSLHGFNIETGTHTNYTKEFPGCAAQLMQMDSTKNRAIVGINKRNSRFHDLYLLNLDTGELQLILQNDRFAKFLFSDSLELILKVQIHEDGCWSLLTEDEQLFSKLTAEEAFQAELLSYSKERNAVYLLDSSESNTSQLIEKSLDEPYTKHVLGHSEKSDINEFLFFKQKPIAYATYEFRKKWHILDEEYRRDLDFLKQELGEGYAVINQDFEARQWMIKTNLPDQGSQFFIYDSTEQKLRKIYEEFDEQTLLAKMYPFSVHTEDGYELTCYYTLPKHYDCGGKVKTPIPLVVMPHGGPFKLRDCYEFNPYHQWLANCGYAVLSVNFRLSSGFGKDFVNAGNGEWGGKAHQDVLDAVEVLIKQGITEKGKLAVFGGSYGGYESLASLTFSPRFYNCCIAAFGPSNLKTVLAGVPEYWEIPQGPLSDRKAFFTKQAFITSMGGDPNTQEGAEYLEKCSPLNYLDQIQVPLLLLHGKNDHIVAESESRQIFESMKASGKQASYILFPDEGHGCAKYPNKLMFLDQVERFLKEHLHGEYTPCDEKILSQSSAVVHE